MLQRLQNAGATQTVVDLYWAASVSRRWQLAATAQSRRASFGKKTPSTTTGPLHGVRVQPSRAGNPSRELRHDELAHLGRVAVLGELSGSLAHELAQPLTAILANAEAALQVALRDSGVPREIHAMLQDIIKDDARATAMIERLRSLLARHEVRREAVDLNHIVRDVLALMHSDLIARNVAVKLRLAPRPLQILADAVQMQQVLLNLVVNACEAMAGNPPDERRLTIATRADDTGRRIECSVTDRGHGIPEHLIDRLFQPFVTTKRNGLGLGLAICRSIMEAHGGSLTANNARDGGAVFRVTANASSSERGSNDKRARRARP